jgi:hypothetical protein
MSYKNTALFWSLFVVCFLKVFQNSTFRRIRIHLLVKEWTHLLCWTISKLRSIRSVLRCEEFSFTSWQCRGHQFHYREDPFFVYCNSTVVSLFPHCRVRAAISMASMWDGSNTVPGVRAHWSVAAAEQNLLRQVTLKTYTVRRRMRPAEQEELRDTCPCNSEHVLPKRQGHVLMPTELYPCSLVIKRGSITITYLGTYDNGKIKEGNIKKLTVTNTLQNCNNLKRNFCNNFIAFAEFHKTKLWRL